jgi:hypothetical protein
MKKIQMLLVFLMLFIISGCQVQSVVDDDLVDDNVPEVLTISDPISSSYDEDAFYMDIDFNGDYEVNMTNIIELNDLEDVASPSILVEGNTINILTSGVFQFSGELENGQIIISTSSSDSGTVILVLNDVSIYNENGPAILVKNAARTIIHLADKTENDLVDGDTRPITSDDEELYDAVIFSNDALVINGLGSLNVTANNEDGINSDDELILISGSITITSPYGKGITANDYISIINPIITITSYADGINVRDGFFIMEGGVVLINMGKDGIQSESYSMINGGSLTIEGTLFGTGTSHKGLKSNGEIIINDGTITIYTPDDTIHAAEDISIAGGEIMLTTQDDALHSETKVNIYAGRLTVLDSLEGIEAPIIDISNGFVTVFATDDGFNATSVTTSVESNPIEPSSPGALPPGGTESVDEDAAIIISGGLVDITVGSGDTDAMDSNGSYTQTGGIVISRSALTNGMGGAMDVGGEISITGGTFIGIGVSEVVAVSEGDNLIAGMFRATFTSGEYTIKDSSNQTVFNFTLPIGFTYGSIWISSDKLISGETYIIYQGNLEFGTWEE